MTLQINMHDKIDIFLDRNQNSAFPAMSFLYNIATDINYTFYYQNMFLEGCECHCCMMVVKDGASTSHSEENCKQ